MSRSGTSEETDEAAITRIMAERADWQALLAQDAEDTLDVYLDLKSPHAFLAVRPSLEVARDFRVAVNFLPYTLSYETLGVSKRVGPDMQREPATPAADRKARMYYAAAREYAALQGLPFKSPRRLLDSTNGHRAFLFAKAQELEVPFAMNVYLQGWGSGWQAFELESGAQLKSACAEVGVDTKEFDDYVRPNGPADDALATIMADAEAHGCVGAPHYVFNDPASGKRRGLFGREHLALIRGKYLQAGLARRDDVSAEFSHAWRPN